MSDQWHGGKGSKRRPAQICEKLRGLKYDLIFEKDEKKKASIKKLIVELENETL